jgi:hypothetical protein
VCLFARLVVVRLCVVVPGVFALIWGASTLPTFWQQTALERTANRIVAGQPFKTEALETLIPNAKTAESASYCHASELHSAVIIRLRLVEQALSEDELSSIDSQLTAIRASIGRSLACWPSDSFLWMALYWVETIREGFRLSHVKYLRLSYLWGPNEGWIAEKRNGISLAVFERLPPDLAEIVLEEFAKLLKSGFYDQTIAILTGPGWSERDKILPRLKQVATPNREEFARALYRLGYDVNVPGVAAPDPRPWY